MKKITPQNLSLFNRNLRHESPNDIVDFALEISENPIVTTSFGAYSAAILHACTQNRPEIPVIWCDTGYNTPATYHHVQTLTERLQLNLDIFTPKLTTAFLDHTLGRPEWDNPNHDLFSEQVKLEPFKRAIEQYKPDVWFSNVRKGQTQFRDSLDILSLTETGILKVSPFYNYSDDEVTAYIKKHQLPLEFDYFDPVKALSHRECGIHLGK
ncbi:phosphoadenosine phosphosulfate reductase family protein [Aureisphaera galaxeae]|uniref:phosphoadenosine phosphosulfate reductase domain-containing protein n=1 Tax=Aureisphaera galaxeae TaxID=1538023 RepID=UPI00235089EA|nr:phosphoadenosine phosphosulfate reductase family protein [Aureisphaera galaxeae]MDC8003155.1 phosphoadenosine phosphosulfate reductase family protein [Aureisphaera galaxeae]